MSTLEEDVGTLYSAAVEEVHQLRQRLAALEAAAASHSAPAPAPGLTRDDLARMSGDQMAELLTTPAGRRNVQAALAGKAPVDRARLGDVGYLASLSQQQMTELLTDATSREQIATALKAQGGTK